MSGARIIPIPPRVLESLPLRCPYCDANGTFDYRGNIMWIVKGDVIEYSLWSCPDPKCLEVVLVKITEQGQMLDIYPKRVPKLDPSVPDQVKSDTVEAYKSFGVGAWRASAAVGRRALQSSLIEQKATKDRLYDQIDELYERDIITKAIQDWAHTIRVIGNTGAHPDKDGLEDVTSTDAKELLDFMEQYLNYVYIMPAKVAERRSAKDQLKRSAPRDIREKDTVRTKSF